MTKTLFKAALAATGLFASPALAAPAATSTFNANAVIIKPVTMTKVTDLDFGTTTMNPSLTTATVTVGATTGDVAVCSDTVMLSCSGGFPASFNLTAGVGGQTVQISFPGAPTQLDHATIAGAFVPFSVASVANVVLAADGTGSFNIGGQITIDAGTDDGAYDAVINVEANYL